MQGPVSKCRPFDFTLTFEQSILLLLPSACFICLAIFRTAGLFPKTGGSSLFARAYRASKKPLSAAYLAGTVVALALAATNLALAEAYLPGSAVATASYSIVLISTAFLIPLHLVESLHDQSSYQAVTGDLSLPFLLLSILFDAVYLRTLRSIGSALFPIQLVFLLVKSALAGVLNIGASPQVAFWQQRPRTREERASILNRLFLVWLLPTLYAGWKRPLTIDALEPIPEEFQGERLGRELTSALYDKQERHEKGDSFPMATRSAPFVQRRSLGRALLRVYAWDMFVTPILPQLLSTGSLLAVPQLVSATIAFAESYTSTTPDPEQNGWGLVGAWGLVFLVASVGAGQLVWTIGRAGGKLRGGLIEVIYAKSLRLHVRAAHQFGGGSASNLLSVDTERIVKCIAPFHRLWSGIIEIAVGSYLLYLQVGLSFLAVPITVLLCVVLTPLSTRGMETKQRVWSAATDSRVNLASSVFTDAKNIKLAGYSDVVTSKLCDAREEEIGKMRKFLLREAFVAAWTNWVSQAMLVVLLATMVIVEANTGQELITTQHVFTALTLLKIIQSPITQLGQEYVSILTALASLRRIEGFLLQEDAPPTKRSSSEDLAARFTNATLGWTEAVLSGVNLSIQRGTTTMICGRASSGKSTLLQAFLGETELLSGESSLSMLEGGAGYVAQDSWVQESTSIRENITFGKGFQPERYRQVLAATALDVDVPRLAEGDRTLAKLLSGGQKQRVSLARALYMDKELFIADDFLSALDAETAAHVFRALFNDGLLKGKTVVMVTNMEHLLPHADLVIRLGNGQIQECGRYEELSAKGKSAIARASIDGRPQHQHLEEAAPTPLEDMQTAGVLWSTYAFWVKACGVMMFLLCHGVMLLQPTSDVAQTFILQAWTAQSFRYDLFGGAIALSFVNMAALGATLGLFAYAAVCRAGLSLHEAEIHGVMRSPLSFFDKHPAGQIISRFSQDLFFADTTLGWEWLSFFMCTVSLLIGIILMSVPAPYMLLVFAGIAVPCLLIQRLYIKSSRQLRRLEMAAKGPIYTLVGETSLPSGLVTMRAAGQTAYCAQLGRDRLDTSQRPYITLQAVRGWLQMSSNLMAMIANVALITLLVVMRTSTSIGILAIAVTRASNVSILLNRWLQLSTEVEIAAVAIERIKEFTELPSEASSGASRKMITGDIHLQNVTATYDGASRPVLSGISLQISSGQRIGICGRSGAGKSSTVLALLGGLSLDAASKITIDGESDWNLNSLRQQITYIPQKPFILAASIRDNLDPEGVHSEAELWDALQRCKLEQLVGELPGKLDCLADGDALFFTPGQKQLFSFARAILRAKTSKIVLLDESTSSLDDTTDLEVQEIIRGKDTFAHCTVITIAHRIKTIIDSDQIYVLGEGRILESGTPSELLSAEDSAFRALASEQRCIN